MSTNTISLQEKKLIVIDFLKKCNAYSEDMLIRYESELGETAEADALKTQQKMHDWSSYRDFNDYAIGELKGEKLDGWF